MSRDKETVLKYQFVIFGDFSHIRPDEATLKKCIESYFSLGMIPNGSLQELDSRSNRLEPRLSLQSIRDGITVNFLNGRIDFVAVPVPGSPSASLDVQGFCSRVSEIYGAIYRTLSVDFVRVGLVTEKFLKPMSPESLDRVRGVFVGEKFSVFPDLETVEWNVRSCFADVAEGGVDQRVNVAYNVSRARVQIGDMSGQRDFDTLHLVVDINTPPDRKVASSAGFVDGFLAYSQAKESAICDALVRVAYESL